MNLIQKIVKKVKEKIDELLLIRKVKSTVESLIIEQEEDINRRKKYIEEHLEEGNILTAMVHWKAMIIARKNIELLEEFKNYVLNNEKNEGRYTVL